VIDVVTHIGNKKEKMSKNAGGSGQGKPNGYYESIPTFVTICFLQEKVQNIAVYRFHICELNSMIKSPI
jgi:hypothetical protein